jgi:MFS family permease
VSGVQAAVAIEALVSAAFILIGSKVGDLFGRKRAYMVGLVLYALGALAMVVGQGLAAIIVFWAVVGGLGASLYLPAMQSLIHGNFEGKMQAKVYALVGASAAIAAAIGPLLGGFLTTLLSWRVGFLLEAAIIAVVLSGAGMIRDTLAPISEERVGEAAGVNSATGSFGLSFGLAFAGAIMLATLSIAFTNKAESSNILPPDDKQHVADVLEDDAQVMSDAQLEELLANQPSEIRDEIISINTDARHLALQVALLLTLIAALIGLFNAFRMMRLPDPQPSGSVEGMALG